VARLVEKKGIADAIVAMSHLILPYEYIVVGDGPLRERLAQLAAARGVSSNVTFAGAQPASEVINILHSADVLLAPSVTAADGDIEGIPVSIIEGMSAGLPVVATRHSGIPEAVADGRSGFLVAEHDVDGLVKCLSELGSSHERRRQMGLAGADIIRREFDISMLTDRLVGMYRELAGEAQA
jgi:colanic acid/amylovoran biosynthesis glycosyltransferase